MESSSLQELEQIPGVGKTIARDMHNIGIHSIDALKGRQAQQLYDRLCQFKAFPVDRCMLYVFRCAIYYASNTHHDPSPVLTLQNRPAGPPAVNNTAKRVTSAPNSTYPNITCSPNFTSTASHTGTSTAIPERTAPGQPRQHRPAHPGPPPAPVITGIAPAIKLFTCKPVLAKHIQISLIDDTVTRSFAALLPNLRLYH